MPAGMDVQQGDETTLNITGNTLIKAAPGRVARISVTVAGSGAGTVNDSATIGGASAANTLAAIPNAVGVIFLDMPFYNGLVIIPGTGQTIVVSWS